MATWTIDPCGEHVAKPCSCSDGKFTIPNESTKTDFVISYTNGSVTKEINYHKSKECIKCNCTDISFAPREDKYFSVDPHPDTEFGTISYADGCTGIINVYGSTGLSNLKIVGNKVIGDIGKYDQTLDENARKLTIWFGVKGQSCPGRYEFYQQAFRGTDNGVDTFGDGTEQAHPIYIPGYKQKAITDISEDRYCRDNGVQVPSGCQSGKLIVDYNYSDSDTIVSEGGAWIYYKGGWRQLKREIIEHDYPGGMKFGEGDWLSVFLNDISEGYCNVGMMVVQTKGEWDGGLNGRTVTMKLGDAIDAGYARAVRFKLATNPNEGAKKIMTTEEGCSSNPEHAGEECARTWWYDVIQLPKNHYVCDNRDGDYRNYTLMPLNETCPEGKKKRCNCKCA